MSLVFALETPSQDSLWVFQKETVVQVKSLTWKYARRQKTWFKQVQGVKKILIEKEESARETASRILKANANSI